jgi:phage head maturation protease
MKLNERAQLIRCGLAGPSALEGLHRDDLLAIKGDQSEVHYRFVGGDHAIDCMKAAGPQNDGKPRFRHVASDESVDSVGDIIRVAGWELERFQKNPVLLWAHDQRALPLGLVENVRKGRASGQKALLTESVFHDAEVNPMAEMVGKLVESGALPGVSVGFVPKEFVYPENAEERVKLGLGEWGVLHVKQELVELSVVPVPANGNALKRSLDLAEPILADERWEREMVEACRAYLGLESDQHKALRHRPIFFMGETEPRAKQLESEPVVERKALPGEGGAPPTPLPTSTSVSLDEKSLEAIEQLSESVGSLVKQLTKGPDDKVAPREPDGSGDGEGGDDPVPGPGETFAKQVEDAIKEIRIFD